MDDLTILSCNHGTPELISNLITSIKSVCEQVPKIYIVETGGNDTSHKVIHKGSGVTYTCKFNTSHGDAVNLAMDMVKTKYMLLVDSDVLFLKDIKLPFQKFKDSGVALMGEIVGDRGGKRLYPRVNPWFCFMDLKQLKNNNIKFYDHYRTKILSGDRIYDIGSTMYEDVLGKGLEIGNAKMEGKYFKHYEGMSWRVQKYNPNNGDTDIDIGGTHDNKALYEYGLKVWEQYRKDVDDLY